MNETQGPNVPSGRVDGQVGAVQRVSPLALVVVAVMLVVFGTYDVATAGVVAAEVAGGGPLPYEPHADLAARAAGTEGAALVVDVFLPFE